MRNPYESADSAADSERAMREAKSCREALDRMQRLHEDERRAVETAAKELADKLCAAVVAKEEEAGRRLEIQETNKEYRQTIDKLRNQVCVMHCISKHNDSILNKCNICSLMSPLITA